MSVHDAQSLICTCLIALAWPVEIQAGSVSLCFLKVAVQGMPIRS